MSALALRVATGLRGLERLARPEIEIVWTGPEAEGPLVRPTTTVIEEMLAASARPARFLIVGYSLTAENGSPMAAIIDLLGEVSRRRAVVTMILHSDEEARNRASLLDAWDVRAIKPRLSRGSRRPEFPYTKLHAKVLVVDRLDALVTSANLTFHGLRANLELGLRVRGPQAMAIARRFDHLIASEVLEGMAFRSSRPRATMPPRVSRWRMISADAETPSRLRMGQVFRDARPKRDVPTLIDGSSRTSTRPSAWMARSRSRSRRVSTHSRACVPSTAIACRRSSSRRALHKIGMTETPWQDLFDADNGRIRHFDDNRTPGVDPATRPGNRVLFEAHARRTEFDPLEHAKWVPLLLQTRSSKRRGQGICPLRGRGRRFVELVAGYSARADHHELPRRELRVRFPRARHRPRGRNRGLGMDQTQSW